jgi:hypothetical protein
MHQVQDGGAAQAAPVARLSVAEVETVLLPTPETFEACVGAAVAGEGACDPLGMEVEGGPQDQFWAPSCASWESVRMLYVVTVLFSHYHHHS